MMKTLFELPESFIFQNTIAEEHCWLTQTDFHDNNKIIKTPNISGNTMSSHIISNDRQTSPFGHVLLPSPKTKTTPVPYMTSFFIYKCIQQLWQETLQQLLWIWTPLLLLFLLVRRESIIPWWLSLFQWKKKDRGCILDLQDIICTNFHRKLNVKEYKHPKINMWVKQEQGG